MAKEETKSKNCRFPIDFFEFSFLVEACVPPRPIARAMFWDDVINVHYHTMTQNERNGLYDWINRSYGIEQGIKNGNEDCLLFNARFDKNNQFEVVTIYEGKVEVHQLFLWKGRYHLSKTQSVEKKYITKIRKIEQ